MLSQLEDAESQISGFTKVKQQMNSQIEDAKRVAEDEARARSSLQQQLRNLNSDFSSLKSQFDDEVSIKADMQRQLSKAHVEAQQWRSKYETEGVAKSEELEEAKRKLSAKLQEAEEQVESALIKVNIFELE